MVKVEGTVLDIDASILRAIELNFFIHYQKSGHEARALVYRNIHTQRLEVVFMNDNTTDIAVVGSPDMYMNMDLDWPLYADLHSHHVMGAYFSKTDDENEMVREVVYGVFSWKGGHPEWVLRYWDGQQFVGVKNTWLKKLL